jgi:coenzyme F420-0:L-glutamate ligase/coenzyme F420-1:gamma-L-glutamate ligase
MASAPRSIVLLPVAGMPLIQAGDDLARIMVDCLQASGERFQSDDVLVVAQKVVSKSEGRLVEVGSVTPSSEALDLATRCDMDPRLIEIILRESKSVLRVRKTPGILVVEHNGGFICANAGVDRSNVEQDPGAHEIVALLPENSDESARRIRQRVAELTSADIAVIVNDSHGRAFRNGVIGTAIGVAGLEPVIEEFGWPDLFGYELQRTAVGQADELAAAASLMMGQSNEGIPAVVVRGAPIHRADGGMGTLIRSPDTDMFR